MNLPSALKRKWTSIQRDVLDLQEKFRDDWVSASINLIRRFLKRLFEATIFNLKVSGVAYGIAVPIFVTFIMLDSPINEPVSDPALGNNGPTPFQAVAAWVWGLIVIQVYLNKALRVSSPPEEEFKTELLENCLQRRDRNRRNANLFGIVALMAAWNPTVIGEIAYLKSVEDLQYRATVFAVLSIVGIHFLIALANINSECNWRLGQQEQSLPSDASWYKTVLYFFVPYISLRDFINSAIPAIIATGGVAAVIVRTIWEMKKGATLLF